MTDNDTLTCPVHGYLGYSPGCAECDRAGMPPPQPEPDRVVVQYDLPGTHPPVVCGITDRAVVLIGERIGRTNDPHASVNWISRCTDIGLVYAELETVRVAQARMARRVYPSELRQALRKQLRLQGTATLADLESIFVGPDRGHRTDLIAELARMRDDGEVRFSGPRYVWVGTNL